MEWFWSVEGRAMHAHGPRMAAYYLRQLIMSGRTRDACSRRIKEAGWLPTKAARASLHGALRDPAKWFAIMSTGTPLVNLCSEFVDTFGQPSLPPNTTLHLKKSRTYEAYTQTNTQPRVEPCVRLPMFTWAWVGGGGERTSHGTIKTFFGIFFSSVFLGTLCVTIRDVTQLTKVTWYVSSWNMEWVIWKFYLLPSVVVNMYVSLRLWVPKAVLIICQHMFLVIVVLKYKTIKGLMCILYPN